MPRGRIGAGGIVVLALSTAAGLFVGVVGGLAVQRLGDDGVAPPATVGAPGPATTSPGTTAGPETTGGPDASPPTTTATTTTDTTLPALSDAELLGRFSRSVGSVEAVGCGSGTLATAYHAAPGRMVTGASLAVSGMAAMIFDAAGAPLGPFVADGVSAALTLGSAPGSADPLGAEVAALPEPGAELVVVGRLAYADRNVAAASGVVDAVGGDRASVRFVGIEPSAVGSPVFRRDGRLVGVVASVDSGTATVIEPPDPAQPGQAQEPRCPVPPGDLSPPRSTLFRESDHRAFLVAQSLATALAEDDWATVRVIEPARASFSDRQFEEGWGTLVVSTLVPISAAPAGAGRVEWRLGLVAHESIGGSQVTKLFCVTWVVDHAAGTVVQTGRDGRSGNPDSSGYDRDLADRGGWVDPARVASTLEVAC